MAVNNNAILLHIKECRNLKSSHAEKFACFARVEHCGNVLGDSGRSELTGDDGEMLVDLKVELECALSDHGSLNDLARNPLLVIFLEVLPKDKKSKEEKTSVLGQASIDLLPFLRAPDISPVSNITTVLQSLGAAESSQSVTEQKGLEPEVDIEVIVPSSVLGSPDIAQSNILSLRLRSLHSLPDSWQPGTFPHTFTLAFPLPSSNVTPTLSPEVIIPQGTLKLGPDKDASCNQGHWKWPGGGQVPNGVIQIHALEDEAGELNSKQDVKFRQSSECEKPRVSWNVQYRAWLPPNSTQSLLSQLSHCPVWPVEIGRYSLPLSSGKNKVKDEEPTLSHHAVAYLNLAPLLYPGATQVYGAYTLHPFSENDIKEKTKRQYSVMLTQPQSVTASSKKPVNKRAPSSNQKLNEPSGLLNTDGTDQSMEDSEVKSEAQVFVDCKSYVVLEIELEKPLIPKRPTSVLAERISEYIHPRPPVPRREGGVKQAVTDYHQKTGEIASVLLSEFRELFGKEVASGTLSTDQEAVNERRKKLLFHLNSSGKYHAFKEQLKVAVVKLVREKYLTQAKTDSKEQLQEFLSELYVFLTDQMHIGLNKVLSLEDAAPPPPYQLDSDLLKTFAFEAEQCSDLDLAKHYYKERVAHGDHVAEHWYDYGAFCLLDSDIDQAEQCFKEAVSLDQTLVPALLLYGMVCCLDDKFSEAEQFFELATTVDPANIIAWTMRGLYYELAGNGVYQEMCFQEASKLNLGQNARTFIIPSKKKRGSASQPIPGLKSMSRVSMSSKVGGILKQPSIISVMAGGGEPQTLAASNHSVSSRGSNKEADLSTKPMEDLVPPPMETKQRGPTESFISFNDGPTTVQPEDGALGESDSQPPVPPSFPNLISGSGASIKSAHSGQYSTTATDAQPPSGSVPAQQNTASEDANASIFLQTASYLLDVHALKFAEMSLAHEVAGCEGELTPHYHVAEARLHLHKECYDEAKGALNKAIVLNYQDANAWALMGHTHYLTGDFPAAKDAYERTVNYVNSPAHLHTVLLRLADIYLRDKQFEMAKETFLRACRHSPTSWTWRGVGVACYELGDLSQAEDALCEANILNNLDPLVWAYLTMICLKTKRPVEAEQAFKFAIKTGLRDFHLVEEIQQLQRLHAPSAELAPFPPTVVCS